MVRLPEPTAALPLWDRKQRRRRDLRLVTVAWVFGAAWMYVANGAVMQEFLRTLNTPEWAFGVFAALPAICGLMQLPGALLIERFAIRKRLFLWTVTISRALFVAAGVVPWVLPGAEAHWWVVVTWLVALSWALGHTAGPAWNSWMTQVIPRRVRGRYFAFRGQVGQVIGITVTLGTGVLLDSAGGALGADDHRLRIVTSLLLIASGVLGVLDIQCFHPIDDDAEPARSYTHHHALLARLRQTMRNRMLWLFLAFMLIFHLGIGFLPAYVYLFVRVELGMSMTMFNVLVAVFPLLITIAALRFWGRIIDRVGQRKVLAVSSMLTVLGPSGWLLCTREVFWPGYVMTLVSPFAFAGLMLAVSNMTMAMTSARDSVADGQRAEHASTINAALVSIAAAIGAVLSGVMGGAIAELYAGFRLELDTVGIVLTYHGLLFMVSMGLRFIAALFAMAMVARHEPRLRDAVKQQVGDLRARFNGDDK